MKQHIKTVKEFNQWRKCGLPLVNVGYAKQLGIALDEVVKAAERYELLRAQHWNDSTICVVCNPKDAVKLGYDCPSGNRLDDLVDKMIAERK